MNFCLNFFFIIFNEMLMVFDSSVFNLLFNNVWCMQSCVLIVSKGFVKLRYVNFEVEWIKLV